MRPLSYTRPKVMLTIANKPLVEHLVMAAKEAGIEEFVFVTGYHSEMVQDYFSDGKRWGINIEYITQRKQLGTANAVQMVEGFVGDRFLLINGDVLFPAAEIGKMSSLEHIGMGITTVADPRDYGVVEITPDSRITRIWEKPTSPPSNLANTGIYLLTGDIFQAISRIKKSPRGEFELTDSLQLLIDEGHLIKGERIDGYLDVSYPWDLLNANDLLLKDMRPENLGVVEKNVTLEGSVAIGKDTVIRSNSYIMGPVVIGEHCVVGPHCFIRPSTAIGDNCHIGSAVEIKNSIIMRNTHIPHHNYVGDSIIGEGCNLGAGAKIANLRLDKQEIQMNGIPTGRQKLGAIIGDDVQIGINACINVGTTIGWGSRIGPGALVSGTILPHTWIF